MKKLHLIILTVTLLLSQWGSIDHLYHAHKAGEVCDYCISAQPLEHAVSGTAQSVVVVKEKPVLPEQSQTSSATTYTRYYAARAPPRFI